MRRVEQGAPEARMRQLLSVASDSVAHYVRQAVQLLRGHNNIVLDFHRLLDDLVIVHSAQPNSPLAHQVHMRWARDFHRAPKPNDTDDQPEGASA